MATNSPSEINGSDPTVLRQIERQNTALQTRGVSAPPSVSGTSGANTTTTAGAVRNLAPIVSGSETLYPQSTTATSSSAVTINSSINNDTGDVTTVYTTNGRITVNPINQTINQYTSVDSGVSQIVAGNGVTISSTGSSGTGVVTINASTVALGNIVSVNLDGNSANVLHGDGSWSADQTTYGNSNVAAYLPTYTGNIGGNVVTANLFAGNGSSLSAIAGANVSGFVPNANVANTAFAVAAANVSGLGNIATINLTGSNANVLYGNGVFAAVAGGANTGNVTFDDVTVQGVNGLNLSAGSDFTANLAYLQVRAGDVASHIHLDTGNNEAYDQYFGNDSKFVKLGLGIAGNVSIGTYQDGGVGQLEWVFDSNGNLVLAGGESVIQSIPNSSLDPLNPNVSTMVLTPDASYNSQALVLDPTAPGHIHLRAPGANIDEPSANIFLGGEESSFEVGYYNGAAPNLFVHSGNTTWTFDNTGNLNLPTNGELNFNAGGIVQAVDEDFRILVQDAEDDGFALLLQVDDGTGNVLGFTELQRDSFSIQFAGGGAPQFRFNESGETQLPGNVRWDTYVDQSLYGVSDNTGNGTVELKVISYASDTLGSNVRVTQSNAYISTSNVAHTWTFGDDGRLTFPGTPRIDTADDNFEVQAAENINFEANAVVNIYTDAGNTTYQWQFGDDGNLIVPGNTAIYTSDATGGNAGNSITIKAGAADQSDYYTTAGGNLNLVGGLGATDDGGGGGPGGDVNIASGLSADPAGHAGNVNITAGSNDWVFDYNGDLTLPGNLVYIGASPAPSISGFNSVSAEEFTNDTSNVTINANSSTWTFGTNDNLYLPDTTSVIANASITLEANSTGNITGLSVNGDADANLYAHSNVNIVSDGGNREWTFDTTGTLTTPGDITVGGDITGTAGANTLILKAQPNTNTSIQLNSIVDSTIRIDANLEIITDSSNTSQSWNFDITGNLTLPGNTLAINYANGDAAFGNIVSVNLDGNVSNVLLGNGVFASIPSTTTIANGNSNVSIATANGNVTISAVGNTTMTVTGTGANVTGTLTSTGKIGYASGSTVTQITSRGTGVTINALAGTIVTTSAAMVATEIDTFAVTNSSVDPNNDIVLAQIVSPNQGTYNCIANPAVIGGFNDGFYINIVNISGFTTADETITIRFMVFKAPNA